MSDLTGQYRHRRGHYQSIYSKRMLRTSLPPVYHYRQACLARHRPRIDNEASASPPAEKIFLANQSSDSTSRSPPLRHPAASRSVQWPAARHAPARSASVRRRREYCRRARPGAASASGQSSSSTSSTQVTSFAPSRSRRCGPDEPGSRSRSRRAPTLPHMIRRGDDRFGGVRA
jgi:hypothetical protein